MILSGVSDEGAYCAGAARSVHAISYHIPFRFAEEFVFRICANLDSGSLRRSGIGVLGAVCLAACQMPTPHIGVAPYRMEIQQGNFISQETVAQLKVGMSKDQVRFVLGSPLVTDLFHGDRWDYVYYRDFTGGRREQRKMAVFFDDGKLVRVSGDVMPAGQAASPAGAAAAGKSPEGEP